MVGYRHWKLEGGYPKSVVKPYTWTPGINYAECKPFGKNKCANPPGRCDGNRESGCGFHGFYDPETLKWSTGLLGIVVGGGRMFIHENAWRAAEALVVAMIDNSRFGLKNVPVEDLRAVAEYFGVPIVPFAGAQAFAAEYGSSVPQDMIPTGPRDHGGERG